MSPIEPDHGKADLLHELLRDMVEGDNLAPLVDHIAEIGHYRWNRQEDCLESCSEQYKRIFNLGNQSAQTESHNPLDRVHPDDRQSYQTACQAATAGNHLDIEYRIINQQGDTRHVREVSIYVSDQGLSLRGDYGIVQDITRRVQREQALLQHNELASEAENLFDIGHFIFNEDKQRFLYMSPGFARVHGTNVKEYTERVQSFEDDLQDIVEADQQRVASAYQYYIASAETLDIEYRIIRPDGELRWLRELNKPRLIKRGRVIETLGVLQDITWQKEVEMALRYREDLSVQAEIVTDIGHFVFNETADRFSYVSPGLARIYGVEPDFLINKITSSAQDMQFVHEDDRETVRARYDEMYNQRNNPENTPHDHWQLEYRMVRANGEVRWVREISKKLEGDQFGQVQSAGVIVDITERKLAEQKILEANENLENQVRERTQELAKTVDKLKQEIAEREKVEKELEFLANHDSLTGLPSLRLGRDRLDQALVTAHRDNQNVVVMFLDLDGFKKINDQHGHDAGDQVLKVVVERLRAEVREQDTVARIGGDEFIIIQRDIPDTAVTEKIARCLIDSVDRPIALQNDQVNVGVSIGIAIYPDNGTAADDLIKEADEAMYQVKYEGKNNYRFSDSVSGQNSGASSDKRRTRER